MNILCLCNQATGVEIIKTIKADTYFMITAKKKIDQKQLPPGYKIGDNVFAYSHKAMKRGSYYPTLKWRKLVPLDRELLESMAYCEAETLKMYERVGKINTSLYENRRAHYLNHLRYWNHIIETNKIGMFFRSAPPHEGYDNIIYHLCKLKNIPVFMFSGFHPGLAYLSRDIRDPFPDMQKALAGDLSGPLNPVLMKLAEEHWQQKRPSILPVIVPKGKIKTHKKLTTKNAGVIEFYNKNCSVPDYTKPYIYFPLQYQYEATTCPMAGMFADLPVIAQILARSGITVYIKEHPRMSKNRSIAYYKGLLAMDNVKFVAKGADNYKLIDKSFAVAVATGTAGWEAILRGKPVLLFGYIFYQYAPGVYRVDNVEMCQKAVKSIKNFTADRDSINTFLKALDKYLFPHTTKDIAKALAKGKGLL